MARGQIGLWIFVLFCVLFFAVGLLIIYLHGTDEPLPSMNVTNVTLYNVTLASNAEGLVQYRLYNGSGILLVQGLLFPGAQEYYTRGVVENASMFVAAWSDQYYYNVTPCNITVNVSLCFIGLQEKALGEQVNLTLDNLTVDPVHGVVQGNVTICWREDSTIVNVIMPLNMTPVPGDLHAFFDFCYVLPEDVVNVTSWPIEVHKNEFNNVSGNLTVLVRDYEIAGMNGIGDRNASVIV